MFGFRAHLLNSHPKGLGRRVPKSFDHVAAHRLSIEAAPVAVEHTMALPWWHWSHDQGEEGACVGHGTAMERAIRELFERRLRTQRPFTVRFDPWWLWDQAKLADGWDDTQPGDENGTSVHAAYDVARTVGLVRQRQTTSEGSYPGVADDSKAPDRQYGVTSNSWATSVDEMRACIYRDQPVTIGINWYSNFDTPVKVGREYFVGRSDLGTSRGGHCVCIYGASDKRQAFKVKNSWGRSYPLVWLPYSVMTRLLSEDGEACVATDVD